MDRQPVDQSWRRKLLRKILRATHYSDQAEDYLQTALVRLEEYRREKPVQDAEAFLVRTAINVAIDDSRKRKIRYDCERSFATTCDIHDSRPLQSEVLEARERITKVKQALSELPPRTRAVFLMHRLDGLKYREIAVKLHVSVSAVEKHVAKALLHLTERVAND